MPVSWSKKEVELIVSDYFEMLQKELSGTPFNKSEHNKKLSALLDNRSKGSIEFKHQNISAILLKLDYPYINGYKKRSNYQKILEEEVIKHIQDNLTSIKTVFSAFTKKIPESPNSIDFNKIIDSPPVMGALNDPEDSASKKPIKINYLEREQSNSLLGLKGEQIALAYEKWRLKKIGKESWIERIEWISQSDDSAGFDILSKNENGTDRYIEVKTTKLNKEAPIFFSRNELKFSQKKYNNFHLYRVFNFAQDPKIFCLNGSFDSFCKKEALNYKGYF